VEGLFNARQLHAEAAIADLQQRDPIRLLLAVLVLQPRDDVLARREADHLLRGIGRRTAFRVELWNGRHDGPDRRAAVALYDHAVAWTRNGVAGLIAKQERLGPAHRRQLDGDERRAW